MSGDGGGDLPLVILAAVVSKVQGVGREQQVKKAKL